MIKKKIVPQIQLLNGNSRLQKILLLKISFQGIMPLEKFPLLSEITTIMVIRN